MCGCGGGGEVGTERGEGERGRGGEGRGGKGKGGEGGERGRVRGTN